MTNETQSNRHDDQARVLAAASPSRQDRTGAAELMTPAEVAVGYVTHLPRELGEPGADRFHNATRAAPILAADETAWPECWRQAVHAVELCRRAAETAARR